MHEVCQSRVGETLAIGNPADYARKAPEGRLFRQGMAIDVEPVSLEEMEG